MEKPHVFQSPTIRFLKITSIVFQVVSISACLFLFADYADNKAHDAGALAGQDAILMVGCVLMCGVGVLVYLLCDIAQSLRWTASQQIDAEISAPIAAA